MILEKEEREKFIKYCEQQLMSNRLMIKTLKENKNVYESILVKRFENLNVGYEIVLKDLQSTESMEVC